MGEEGLRAGLRVPGPLPYPGRFRAARRFARGGGARRGGEEEGLLLWALERQAERGPAAGAGEPPPGAWDLEGRAKAQAWAELGELDKAEAMRLYVRALERVAPTWWEELCMEEAGAAVALGGAGGGAVGSGPALSDGGAATQAPVLPSAASLANVAALRPAVPGRWEALGVEGRPPPARYMHAAAAAPGGGLLVFGGDSGARLLSAADMWRLNPEPLAWHLERPPSSCDAGELPPALSAHTVTRWGHHLVVVGGFSRASAQEPLLSTVHLFDLQERAWSRVAVGGPAPPARGNHSAALLGGSRLVVFGGETPSAQVALGDFHVLDLEAMAWLDLDAAVSGGAPEPAPRSAAIATAAPGGRHMIVFGGGCNSRCFDDLWALDSESWEWWQPQWRNSPPAARAGHAGARVGAKWVVTGGGDLHRGFKDTHSLDLSGMPETGPPEAQGAPLTWERLAGIGPQGEGMSVVACGDVLVAFGGYDGKYHNEVALLELDLSGETSPRDTPPPAEAPGEPAQAGVAAPQTEPRTWEGAPEEAPRRRALSPPPAAAAAAAAPMADTPGPPGGLEQQLKVEREKAEGALRELEDCRRLLQEARDQNFRQEALVAELRQQLSRLQHEDAGNAAPKGTRGILDYITGA